MTIHDSTSGRPLPGHRFHRRSLPSRRATRLAARLAGLFLITACQETDTASRDSDSAQCDVTDRIRAPLLDLTRWHEVYQESAPVTFSRIHVQTSHSMKMILDGTHYPVGAPSLWSYHRYAVRPKAAGGVVKLADLCVELPRVL
ncbi:MAG: hypothetical protein AAGC55_07035 [Myxococcota bacterium]